MAVLGKNGVEKVWEVPLEAGELASLQGSARHVQELVRKVNELKIIG